MEDYGTVKLSRRERQIMEYCLPTRSRFRCRCAQRPPRSTNLLYSSGTVGNLGGEGVPHPRKRWQTLYLLSNANHAILQDVPRSNRFSRHSLINPLRKTVIALVSEVDLSDEELDRLSQLIEQAKKGDTSS